MLLLLRRPIRRYRFGIPPKRVSHHYRVLNLLTNQACATKYNGKPRDSYTYQYTWSVTRALAEGWLVYKPAIGLPVGV